MGDGMGLVSAVMLSHRTRLRLVNPDSTREPRASSLEPLQTADISCAFNITGSAA